jgi:hypothetical protein
MDAEAVRRAAVVLAAMHPGVRSGLLADLDGVMRAQIVAMIDEVTRRGWSHRAVAMRMLESAEPAGIPGNDSACEDLFSLSGHLSPGALACVLQAEGIASDDFRLAMIPTSFQAELRSALGARPPMPPQLRDATRVATKALLGELRERGGHAPR